jgi:hypothetical protein
MTSPERAGEVEHRLGEPGGKLLVLLSNSEVALLVEGGKSGLGGKLLVREGDNPDPG